MATTRHLVVLAHSCKHRPGVCVAGREVRLESAGYRFGPWIRPVSHHDDGELLPQECQLPNGWPPSLLDFVEVPFDGPAGDRSQPENWRIEQGRPWRLVNEKYQKPLVERMVESPADLWREDRERNDRISVRHVLQNPPEHSLYLIRTENLRAQFDWAEREGVWRERHRALFVYRGVEYEFSITDLKFQDRHRRKFPRRGHPAVTFAIRGQGVLCVSLSRPFRGYHYKLAATIFE